MSIEGQENHVNMWRKESGAVQCAVFWTKWGRLSTSYGRKPAVFLPYREILNFPQNRVYMVGPNIFVQVQSFMQPLAARSRNFCHPLALGCWAGGLVDELVSWWDDELVNTLQLVGGWWGQERWSLGSHFQLVLQVSQQPTSLCT